MADSKVKESVRGKFPLYNDSERELLESLLVEDDRSSSRFEKSKNQFMEIVYGDLVRYYKWDNSIDDHIALRKRLLNIAGLFVVIPIEDLRNVSHKAKLTLKKVVHESPPSPINKNVEEIHSYDLKYIEGFAPFFSKILLDANITALDYLSGNREKRQYPHTQFTVFRKRIQDEVGTDDFLTASAEPLTQTQLISLYNPDGTLRDLMTIGFDMIYESAFIDYFHSGQNVTPTTLSRNAHILGRNFLTSCLAQLMEVKKANLSVEKEFPVFISDTTNYSEKRVEQLRFFIQETLLHHVDDKIRGWNSELGLPSNNLGIYWEPNASDPDAKK